MASESQKRNIVIIGGGIIGSTTAYFLSHHPSFTPSRGDTITLLEATKIAGGASGKAGGLLALWAYPSSIVPLSYKLHQDLAEKHGGEKRWGYRAVHCGQVDAYGLLKKGENGGGVNKTMGDGKQDAVSLQKRSEKAIGLLRAAGVPKDLDWIAAEGIKSYEEMGTPATTAQVHPYLFTTSMAELAQEKGVQVVFGSAKRINKNAATGAVESVTYTPKPSSPSSSQEADKVLQATDIILTAGPWTKTILPTAPISALRAHSVTIRPSRPVSAYALFTSIDLPRNGARYTSTVTPEIYARPNNEVYACGEGDHLIPLPTSSDLVQCDDAKCEEIFEHVSTISEELRDGEVTARQACYLPNVEGRAQGPIIGETSTKGLFIGAGHTCWGIQNGPGTGKCLAEAVWEGKVKSAKLSALEPKRFGL